MPFPKDFAWGAGASSVAAEGAATGSDVRAWEDAGRLQPTGSGSRFGTEFADDLALLGAHGLRHLRYVLDWTRLEPQPGKHDVEAIEHATRVLEAARAAGISIWGCLHDGALPGWFSVDEQGFSNERSSRYFWSRHVEFIGETFGALVHGWVPTHEPNRWAARGWLDGTRPPGRRDDAEHFAEALEGVLLATVDAALRLREDGHPVASAQWLPAVFAARLQPDAPPTPEAQVMADLVDEVHRRCWLRMIEEETLVVPGRAPVAVAGARSAFDLVGFTYRHALAVRGDGALLPYPQALAVGADGQVAWAEGLAVVLHRLADALPDRSLLIAGTGLSTPDEALRHDHLRDLLAVAEDAVDGGMDLRGLWWTTPIDPGDSSAPPGLFDTDREPRPAAALLQSVALGGPVPH